ncbi:MAG: RecQ family ATP-dependent DNA helicase [Chloroflexota bacterium]
MANSLLEILDFQSDQITELTPPTQNHLLDFLIRWEGYHEAFDCLAKLGEAGITSTDLLDLQAQILLGVERSKEAFRVMEARLEQNNDLAGWLLYGRCLLEARQKRKALQVAKRLTDMQGNAPSSWSFLGDVHHQRNKRTEAERAYLQSLQIEANWPAAQIGLMHLHQRQGDSVTAMAYAVRAYAAMEGMTYLPADEFQQLLDYFAAVNDANWTGAASRLLQNAFNRELADIHAALNSTQPGRQTALAKPKINPQINSESTQKPPQKPSQKSKTKPRNSVRIMRPVSPDSTLPVPEPLPKPAPKGSLASPAEEKALTAAANDLFGFTSLRPPQAEIMACARRGEHVLAILPTGAGKSLCYQLLAFADPGMTLVISPLIALMKDQIDNLPPKLQMQTLAINSTLSGQELRTATERIAQGDVKLIYAAPERLRQLTFLHALGQGGITRLVIDEAHCVSIWGHDFRPDYLHVAQAHKDMGTPPIMALTATAPPQVRHDIQRQLFGTGTSKRKSQQFQIITTDTFRPNLKLSATRVRNNDERLDYLITLCRELVKDGSGLIYARTRRRCEDIAELLQTNGINAEHYHAGIPNRAELQERFMQNQVQVVVATIAFGMGVDKPDIRFVIHHGLPDSVESYYQEAGRAGRDGEASRCTLLYTSRDESTLKRYAEEAVVSVEHLRLVYGRLKSLLAQHNPGLISLDELKEKIRLDQTQVRVALSMLEEVELIQRHYDSPRSVSLKILKMSKAKAFGTLLNAMNLTLGAWGQYDYIDLAERSGISPVELEGLLLKWQDRGNLTYSAKGRTLLISLNEATDQASRRIESLLDQYATIQMHRVTEIVGYANTLNCRHGHLGSYLGGEKRTDCGACDICLERQQIQQDPSLPNEMKQYQLVLQALDGGGWGKRNLTRLLRGDDEAPPRCQQNSVFGQLHFRSETSVEQIIGSLLNAGYISENQMDHGGVALGLTQRGRRAVKNGEALGHLV